MRLEINGKLIAEPASGDDVLSALGALQDDRSHRVALMATEGAALRALGTPANGFILQAQVEAETFYTPKRPLAVDELALIMAEFADGEPSWRERTRWRKTDPSGRFDRTWRILERAPVWNLPAGAWAFLIFGGVYTVFMAHTLITRPPGMPGIGTMLAGYIAIGFIAGYIQYIDIFFRRLRPAIMKWLAGQLGVQIEVSPVRYNLWVGRTGDLWEIQGQASTGKHLLVTVMDLAVLLALLVGPVALIAIPAFIIAENLGL